jgi:hypothetical protein
MRFPSLHTLAARARHVLTRFPVTLATGVAAAVCAIIASTTGADDVWLRLTLVVALGLPLSVALALLAEVHRWRTRWRLLLMLAGAGALTAFFFVWPGMDEKHHAIRYVQLAVTLHLAVAVLPLIGRTEGAAFWQYNRRLFLSFLRAVVFSGVLFVGLVIALAALDKLFALHVPGQTYLRLWLILAFIINTWIFLAGVPDEITALVPGNEYPKALKIFTQYILTPLVAVYLLILLAYLVKILITGEWPSGWIGYLVTSVSVAGILGFLLVHPLRDDPDEGWIRAYRRWLFIALIPAALMLLVAFAKRIEPYGLTELRYLGGLLGVWLLAISLLFTVRRAQGIRIIPLSLGVLLLVTLFGPLGATHRAVVSQSARLEREVAIARATSSPHVATPAEVEASGALYFLVEHHATPAIARAFGGSVPGGMAPPRKLRFRDDSVAGAIMAAASLDYSRGERAGAQRPGYFSYTASDEEPLAIAGFDWLVPVNTRDSVAVAGGDTLRLAFDSTTQRLTVASSAGATWRFDFRAVVDSLGALRPVEGYRQGVPLRRLHIVSAGGERAGALQLSWLSWRRETGGMRVESWRGHLLIGPVAPADSSAAR